jgi:hypothetical protein
MLMSRTVQKTNEAQKGNWNVKITSKKVDPILSIMNNTKIFFTRKLFLL